MSRSIEVFTGECFGGPYDGEKYSAPEKWFIVDMFSGHCSLMEVNRDPTPNLPPIVVQTGRYLWSDLRTRWEWRAP
jgi:hypothetical protein